MHFKLLFDCLSTKAWNSLNFSSTWSFLMRCIDWDLPINKSNKVKCTTKQLYFQWATNIKMHQFKPFWFPLKRILLKGMVYLPVMQWEHFSNSTLFYPKSMSCFAKQLNPFSLIWQSLQCYKYTSIFCLIGILTWIRCSK